MTKQFYSYPATLARLHAGPLGPYMDAFAGALSERGYADWSIRVRLRVVADLSHWLEHHGLKVDELDEERIARFLKVAPRSRGVLRSAGAVFVVLLEHLREVGVVPIPERRASESALDGALAEFEQYLVEVRGLAPATVGNYQYKTRRFLSDHFGDSPLRLDELSATDVTQYVLRSTRGVSGSSAKQTVGGLRSYLRFAHLSGQCRADLAAAVPSVAPRPAPPRESLEPEQVQRLLASCNRSRPAGLRDFAILLLLARLGLRAKEAAALELSDFDWRAGELTVRGKGRRHDRLPIPQDVGEALTAYLRHGRPVCRRPQVFLGLRDPSRRLGSDAISSVVRRALLRAGLDPAQKGAHLLRHTLATEMLRKGARLDEIGQILRHRSLRTTQIYAHADLNALRELAQPWPGGGA